MSSKASGSPEEECQSSHPDRFPKGFLEEVAAQLDFEVLELAWGMRSEGAGALGSSLGLRSAQDPHTVGLTWLCWVLGAPAQAQRSGCLGGGGEGATGPVWVIDGPASRL